MTIQELLDNAVKSEVKTMTRPEYEPTEQEQFQACKDMIDSKYIPYNQTVFVPLSKWLARYQKGKKHGLLLAGKPGTGKTYFFQTCIHIKTFAKACQFVEIYKQEGGVCDNNFWFEAIRVYEGETWNRNIIIDDMGQEPTCNHYGAVTEVLAEVIDRRYSDWQKTRALTLITSNLTLPQLDKRYGRRTFDRIKEMCDLIEFNGDSVRGRV